MKKFFLFLVLLLIILGMVCLVLQNQTADLPAMQDGDLIFQSSPTNQSPAVALASRSLYTHMGIIKKTADGIVVIEANARVQETPLEQWIWHGILKRVAVYRYTRLTPQQAKLVLAAAKTYYGQPYDPYFSFDNQAMYCSELPYLAFKAAGITLGRVTTVAELHANNALVRHLIEKRWQKDADCAANADNFQECYQRILKRPLITPMSIARDAKLAEIYSNYWF